MTGSVRTSPGVAPDDAPASVPALARLLIDVAAACAMLTIGRRLLWTLTQCGAIPSHRIGRAVRYSPDELRAWIGCGCPTEPGSAERVREAMREGRA